MSESEKARLIDQACDQFEVDWKQGQQPRIESIIESADPRVRDELLVQLLLLEWDLKCGDELQPRVEEYLSRFPADTHLVLETLARSNETVVQNPATMPGMALSLALANQDASDSLGRFRILDAHARGGLGEVFVAHDEELNRRVALKRIRGEIRHNENCVGRFLREAELTGRLEHPNIVPVYGMGRDDNGFPFYAMRFIQGVSLKKKIDEYHQRQTEGEASARDLHLEFRKLLAHFAAVCIAIDYAHSQGVIHRDIKPENVMIGAYGETQVVDWGLAKVVDHNESFSQLSQNEAPSLSTDDERLESTVIGNAIGTPAFMSPEQASGNVPSVDKASDIYGLGATLFVLLTHRRPLEGAVEEILRRASAGDIDSPRRINPEVPRPLEAICMKAMRFNPADRYQSATEMADDIEAYLADEAVSAWREPLVVRMKRWTNRHQATVTSSIAVLIAVSLSLVVGFAVVSRAYRNEQIALGQAVEEKDNAERLQQLADDEAAAANAVASFLESMFRPTKPAFIFGVDYGSPDVDVANMTIEEFFRDRADRIDNDSQLDDETRARLKDTIGDVYAMLGELELAERHLTEAYEIRLESGDELAIATSEAHLGFLRMIQGRIDQSIALLERARQTRHRLLGEGHVDTLAVRFLAILARGEGADVFDHERAQALYRHNLDELQEILELRLEQVDDDHPDVANLKVLLGASHLYFGRFNLGEELLSEANQYYEQSPTPFDIGQIVLRFANAHIRRQNSDMYGAYLGAIDAAKELLGANHPGVLWLTKKSIGVIDDQELKEQTIRRAIVDAQKAFGEQPRTTGFMLDLAILLESQDTNEADEEAKQWFVEILRILDRVYEEPNWQTGRAHFYFSRYYANEDESDLALEHADLALECFEHSDVVGYRDLDVRARFVRGQIHAIQRNWSRAVEDYSIALKFRSDIQMQWFRYAGWCALARDEASYLAACREMLDRFENTDDLLQAELTAKSCLYMPSDDAVVDRVAKMADRLLLESEGHFLHSQCQFTKALTEFRQADYESCLARIETNFGTSVSENYTILAVHALAAMARFRLGQEDAAMELIADVRATFDIYDAPQRPIRFATSTAWPIAAILLREAEELIGV